jgi:N-acetylglutamate synthase-like GNAT family acetyltransferase/DNA-binding MarR family transcriptional regulator
MDLIKQLGPMALGSRLKRLTVRMNKDVSRVYRGLGIDFEARWFPIAYLLARRSPLAITEIADSLGYTHTAIKSFANEMIRKGLLDARQDPADKRKRLLQLSKKGRLVVADLVPVWQEIREVARELVDASDPNLLEAVASVERQLDQQEVYERIRERLRTRMLAKIEIIDYKPAYKRYFRLLNSEWLNHYFRIEASDEKLLSDPKVQIINQGGAVLFARVGKRVVGTAALVRHGGDVFELAKMAVAPDARRRLVGTRLTASIIDRARTAGATELFLESHPRLKAAQRLYEAMGFKRVRSSPVPPKFARGRIVMKFQL